MKSDIRVAIPRLVCGEKTATAFMVSETIAITATHALEDFFDGDRPVKLFFNVDNHVEEVDAEPIVPSGECNKCSNQNIIALRLTLAVKGVKPIKCIDFRFNTPLTCQTYGYPPVRREEGTLVELCVKHERYAEDYSLLRSSWNIDLSKKDDIKDYSGVSGAPLILGDCAVAVLLQQVQEGGEASRLSAASLYLYKNYLTSIGIEVIERRNEPYYEPYLALVRAKLGEQLRDRMLRGLHRPTNNGALQFGFAFKFTEGGKGDKLESYLDLLRLNESAVVLSEPGGGKTYLLSMLAIDLIDNPIIGEGKIPIILNARKWMRSFSSVVEGIVNELRYSIPTVDKKQVEKDLAAGRYLILLDGLDEVTASTDLLIDELVNMSKIENSRILVTCRADNYHKQLFPHYSEFTISALEDRTIQEYIDRELSLPGWQAFYGIDVNVRSLLGNPLFLSMTASVWKATGGIPKNRAQLYEKYIGYLLKDRSYKKGLVSPFEIDVTTKELILSEYAKRTFREYPCRMSFLESICTYLQKDKVQIVTRELAASGLIIEDGDDVNFIHPSFHEFFFALSISREPDHELVEFVKERHRQEEYSEVFIYLAGLLKKENRQAVFLDFLEKNNLPLYRRCLEARFTSGVRAGGSIPGRGACSPFKNQVKEDLWSHDYMLNYFQQIRNSYATIIDSHFSSIQRYFFPWCNSKGVQAPSRVIIEGGMDPVRQSIEFRFYLVSESSRQSQDVILKWDSGRPLVYSKDSEGNDVSIPIITFSAGDYWYIDLQTTDMGMDSAREVALYVIKKRLAEMLDNEVVFEIEPPEMMVAQVEDCLKTLPLERFGVSGDPINRSPSLYSHSLDQIIDLLHSGNILHYAYSLRGSLYFSSEKVIRMVLSLLRLRTIQVDPRSYLLPAPDIDLKQVGKTHWYIWEAWSDQQLCRRISRFYEHYQRSYRFLAETCFPSLKEHLPFYAMGPLRFAVSFYRDAQSGGGVDVTWEPVSDTCKPSVVMVSNREERHTIEREERDYQKTSDAMRKLGRRMLPFFTRSSSVLDMYIRDDNELRKRVYAQLKKDLEHVMGDLQR